MTFTFTSLHSKKVNTKRDLPRQLLPVPRACGKPLLSHISTGDPPRQAGSFGSVFYGVTAPFLWVLVHTGFVCALQDWSLCFLQSCGSLTIKSCCPSRSDSQGIPSPFVQSLSWEPWHGVLNLHNSGRASLVLIFFSCGSPTWWVWGLILSWLWPSYHLAEASSSVDVGYLFFFRFQHPHLSGCSTASCDFGALKGGDEHISFYSTILSRKPENDFKAYIQRVDLKSEKSLLLFCDFY